MKPEVALFFYDLKAPSSASLISRYILRLEQRGCCCFCAASHNFKMYLEIREADEGLFKNLSSVLLISRYILRLGQAAQEQQRPHCPDTKMYLEIRRADEGFFTYQLKLGDEDFPSPNCNKGLIGR